MEDTWQSDRQTNRQTRCNAQYSVYWGRAVQQAILIGNARGQPTVRASRLVDCQFAGCSVWISGQVEVLGVNHHSKLCNQRHQRDSQMSTSWKNWRWRRRMCHCHRVHIHRPSLGHTRCNCNHSLGKTNNCDVFFTETSGNNTLCSEKTSTHIFFHISMSDV